MSPAFSARADEEFTYAFALDMTMHEVVDAGDHAILIGAIKAFDDAGSNGLGYARGAYVKPGTLGEAVAAAAQGGKDFDGLALKSYI